MSLQDEEREGAQCARPLLLTVADEEFEFRIQMVLGKARLYAGLEQRICIETCELVSFSVAYRQVLTRRKSKEMTNFLGGKFALSPLHRAVLYAARSRLQIMPYDNSPLLGLIDLVSPYLPARLTDPLYSLASLDLASLSSNPAQLLPLALSLLAGYTAILSFLSTARFAFRTALSLIKWGSVAALISALYLGYNGAGTERGVSGGVQVAAGYATGIGKTMYSLGQHGAKYWFGNSGGSSSSWWSSPSSSSGSSTTARNRQAREQRRRRRSNSASRASSSYGSGSAGRSAAEDDPAAAGAQAAHDFVGQAFNSVLEYLNPAPTGANDRSTRSKKQTPPPSPPQGDGLSGLAWNMAMGRVRKVWEEMTGGEATGAETRSGSRSRNR